MEVILEGLFSREVIEAAKSGKISRYFLAYCDVYLTLREAGERAELDFGKSDFDGLYGERYFTNRHLVLKDILDLNAEDSFSDFEELILGLKERKISRVSVPDKEYVEIDEGDYLYKLVPISLDDLRKYGIRELEVDFPFSKNARSDENLPYSRFGLYSYV